jgi:hypothetical protein
MFQYAVAITFDFTRIFYKRNKHAKIVERHIILMTFVISFRDNLLYIYHRLPKYDTQKNKTDWRKNRNMLVGARMTNPVITNWNRELRWRQPKI